MKKKVHPKITRIASLKGFDGVLLGRDLADIFKNGHVYSVMEIMGEIMIRDLGEHAYVEWLSSKKGELTGTIDQYALDGTHCLTKEEYKKQLQLEQAQ